MFKKIQDAFDNFLSPVKPVPVGAYQYQGTKDSQVPFRLNLRVEPNGEGILILNASTVLHLNRTAAEFAYHLIQGTPIDQTAQHISERYDISVEDARKDIEDFIARLETLINTPDLDPVTYLDMERVEPYSKKLSAPYRLDCALTYRVSEKAAQAAAPTERVTRELNETEWCTILEKAQAVGIPHVVFTGGEPTLREDLPALIAKTEQLGIVSGLLTDGLHFAEKKYMQPILNAGLDHIMLLADNSEKRFWKALGNLMPQDIAVTVHFTLTKQNQPEAFHTLQKMADADVRSLSLSAVDAELQEALNNLQNRAVELGLSLVWDLPVPYSQCNPIALELQQGGERLAKGAGNAWLYVEPDGDVLPAQGINRVLGNLLKDDWSSIWKKR